MKFSIIMFFKNDNYVLKIYINSLLLIILTVFHIIINSRITINWFFILISFVLFFIITITVKIFFMKSVLRKDYTTVKGRVVQYKRFGVLEYNPHIIVELDNEDINSKAKSVKKIFIGLFNKYKEKDEVVLLLYKNNFILKDNAYV